MNSFWISFGRPLAHYGLYAKRSDQGGDGGDEFMERSHRDGLKSALKWREETFGNRYRGGDGDSAPPSAEED